MTHKLSLKELYLNGRKVLMRVDFNVPLDKNSYITDDTRIKASLPSIQYILSQGGSIILMSHLGRPKGKPSPEFSLAPCAKRLSELIHKEVVLAPDCVGQDTENLAQNLKPGQVLLLENLRFHPEEENPTDDFAKQLAKLGDVYVNDAFGTAHRAHASTATITKYFPGEAAAGFLLEKEIEFLGKTLLKPKKPFYAIIGGAKISSKIGVLNTLLNKVDALLIGGGMAYTFYKAQGISIGESIHEDAQINEARNILAKAKTLDVKIYLPVDNIAANKIDPTATIQIVSNGIPNGMQGVDIGPKTIEKYIAIIQDAATIFWNGPMGIFEIEKFAKGTNALAHALAKLKAITIVGGGESVAAVEAAGVTSSISHISTGGGATLEYIEFGKLPGIDALSDRSPVNC
jgi:phosphoglycerate kinase